MVINGIQIHTLQTPRMEHDTLAGQFLVFSALIDLFRKYCWSEGVVPQIHVVLMSLLTLWNVKKKRETGQYPINNGENIVDIPTRKVGR